MNADTSGTDSAGTTRKAGLPIRWLVEEVICLDEVTYWLCDDRIEAEHRSLMLASEGRGGRILTVTHG